MKRIRTSDSVNFYASPEVPGVELMHAQFIQHHFPPHFHETLAVSLVSRGRAGYRYRSNHHKAGVGTMFAFAPGEIHTGYPIDAAGYGYKVMYLDVGRLNFDEEYILDVDAIAHNLKQPVANLGLAGVVSVFHDSIALPSTRLTRGILMSRVLTELSALVTPAALSKSDEPLAARRMKDYIDTHYAEEISLSVLTTVSQISRARCIEAFTKAYGVPPHAYQIQLRIERSKIALRGPDRLSDVALAVGFYDQSHFTNQFKRYVGVSPGAYKRHLASV